MTQDIRDLIAEAREWAGSYASWGDNGLVDRLADALEASLGERDAAVAAIERVRKYADERSVYAKTRNNIVGSWRIASDLYDLLGVSHEEQAALDGAPEPEEVEWEYGLLVEALGDTEPEPYPTRESAQHVIDHPEMYRKWTHDNPVTMYSRRPAGPWLPVEGKSK